jgi:A/G-specific adenine glycosylase
MVDGNVARVLTRLFDYRDCIDGPVGKRQLAEWSARLADGSRARRFQSGLMEIGQRTCRARQPLCGQCPVAEFCLTREPDGLPVKRERAEIEEIDEHVGYFRDPSRGIVLCRETGGRRAGLWRLPLLGDDGRADLEMLVRIVYPITRYRVTLHVYAVPAWQDLPIGGEWVPETRVDSLALASPYRRALDQLRVTGR